MARFSQNITVSSRVLTQEADGEAVLLDLQGESYFSLDKVGTRIWRLLNEQSDLQSIFDTILAEYNVEPEQLEKDMNNLLKALSDEGLISQYRGPLE